MLRRPSSEGRFCHFRKNGTYGSGYFLAESIFWYVLIIQDSSYVTTTIELVISWSYTARANEFMPVSNSFSWMQLIQHAVVGTIPALIAVLRLLQIIDWIYFYAFISIR